MAKKFNIQKANSVVAKITSLSKHCWTGVGAEIGAPIHIQMPSVWDTQFRRVDFFMVFSSVKGMLGRMLEDPVA